ncbi:hypothetical protein TYRP_016664 [Tyrophagus putrescentiae]|nr:hypothetical protein TYRP_016664 [Tyrophagus putrescentiae]
MDQSSSDFSADATLEMKSPAELMSTDDVSLVESNKSVLPSESSADVGEEESTAGTESNSLQTDENRSSGSPVKFGMVSPLTTSSKTPPKEAEEGTKSTTPSTTLVSGLTQWYEAKVAQLQTQLTAQSSKLPMPKAPEYLLPPESLSLKQKKAFFEKRIAESKSQQAKEKAQRAAIAAKKNAF